MNPTTIADPTRLPHADLLQLERWNTPTIYNGWEQIARDRTARAFNLDETRDFMPQQGPMCGYAITVVIEPSNSKHRDTNPNAWNEYRAYIASVPGPKIVVVQDLDHPRVIGAFWGEVNSSIHRALGCIGTITDGGIRDLDEMNRTGFKALARRFCVGHAFSHPVRWGCDVDVFGCSVKPGQLIHADKHGFLAIPRGDEDGLLAASRFMDSNECKTLIPSARNSAGLSAEEILASISNAADQFSVNAKAHTGHEGEW